MLELIPELQNATMLEGFHYIQVRYLGDDLVLLTGPEGFDLQEALKGSEGGPDAIFDVLYPWSPKDASDYRVTWVRCTGLPVHMWNDECFKEAVKPVGDFIYTDSRTSGFSNLEFARILVRTNAPYRISHYRRVNVCGVVYNFRLMEDLSWMITTKPKNLHDEEDDEEGDSSDWSSHVDAHNVELFRKQEEEDDQESLPETQIQATDAAAISTPTSLIEPSVGDSTSPNVHDWGKALNDAPSMADKDAHATIFVEDLNIEDDMISVTADVGMGPLVLMEDDQVINKGNFINLVGSQAVDMVTQEAQVETNGVGNYGVGQAGQRIGPINLSGAMDHTQGEPVHHPRSNRVASQATTFSQSEPIIHQIHLPQAALHSVAQGSLIPENFAHTTSSHRQSIHSIDLNVSNQETFAVEVRNSFAALSRRSKSRTKGNSDPGSKGSSLSSGRKTGRQSSTINCEVTSPVDDGHNQRRFLWLQRGTSEAKFLWDIGKQCGVSFTGSDDVAVSKLDQLQRRDVSAFGGGQGSATGGDSTPNL